MECARHTLVHRQMLQLALHLRANPDQIAVRYDPQTYQELVEVGHFWKPQGGAQVADGCNTLGEAFLALTLP
jgi:hypothetical protein